jgi:elongator complex protein 4
METGSIEADRLIFIANPSLSAIFPSHHGILHIHTLPAPHTILPPSDKYSTLRGLSSSAVSAGGSGENNLAFKCMRKRLIFETLHLDLEGGVGDRRTTPSSNAIALEAGTTRKVGADVGAMEQTPQIGGAAVEVKLESPEENAVHFEPDVKTKPRKRVAFRSDKPDLYDF